MQKNKLPGYLSFSKKERRGIIAVFSLIFILIFIPFLFPFFRKKEKVNAAQFKKEIAELTIKQADSSENNFAYNKEEYPRNDYQPYEKKTYKIKGELFPFDPNTISEADWKRLGVRDKTIAIIQNYLSKGGKFRNPEDLGKIWGFFPDEIERLQPYVQIKETAQAYADKKTYEPKNYDKPKYSIKPVDINSGDTSAFIALPGIGSKLSQRIIAFRDKLGGFYKVEQVAETFGLPDSTYQKIKPNLLVSNTSVKQININTATVEELKAHPYIRWQLANPIIQYRTQHGNFATLTDLKKIMIIDEVTYQKIAPYLKVN